VLTTPEMLLCGGVLALYLYDSASLLCTNDMIFSEHRGSWRCTVGSSFLIRGRFLFVPNICNPYVVTMRATWNIDGVNHGREYLPALRHFLRGLGALRVGGVVVGILLLVLLPALLISHASEIWLLALLLSTYLTIALMLVHIFRYRRLFALTRKEAISIVFDGLACPPYAINMARKIAMTRVIKEDGILFAAAVLHGDARITIAAQLEDRIRFLADVSENSAPGADPIDKTRSRLRALKA
jgi:hypothetical protein